VTASVFEPSFTPNGLSVSAGLEGLTDDVAREVLEVIEFGLAVALIEATTEQIDSAVVIHGADNGIEVHGAVEEVPRNVTLQGAKKRIGAHDVAACWPVDVHKEFVTAEVESAQGEFAVTLFAGLGGLDVDDVGHFRNSFYERQISAHR
jgi:hypothetical protein